MLKRRACRIQVDFDRQVSNNIRQYRSSNNYVKTMVLNFIDALIGEGYRHFIIYINYPIDLWTAELFYFLIPSYKPLNITYALGLWRDQDGVRYAWMEHSVCFSKELLHASKKIIWRQEGWYEPEYTLKYLKITRQ